LLIRALRIARPELAVMNRSGRLPATHRSGVLRTAAGRPACARWTRLTAHSRKSLPDGGCGRVRQAAGTAQPESCRSDSTHRLPSSRSRCANQLAASCRV